jgi:hypothetical protein
VSVDRELAAVVQVMQLMTQMCKNPRILKLLHNEGYPMLTESYIEDLLLWVQEGNSNEC